MNMKTFRNLTYTFLVLAVTSLLLVVLFTEGEPTGLMLVMFNVCVAVFSVTIVAMIAVLFLYVNSLNFSITVLKRRGSKAYGELSQHKMKLIDVMDGEKPLAEWETFLYSDEEFQRIKKFLYEEYFLLIDYEPFRAKSASASVVCSFYGMHKELENFIRSVRFDKVEYNKFRRQFLKVQGQELALDTPEEVLTAPELREAYEALLSANEYALSNVDRLLNSLDAQLVALDKYFTAGVPWSVTKPHFDAEFHLWMNSKS